MKNNIWKFLVCFFISYSVFADTYDWIHITKRDGIDIYSRNTKNSPIKSLRAEGVIKSSINQITAILRDVPTAMDWVPNLHHRSYVKNISDTEAVLYDVTNLPWPVKDRDMVVHHRLVLSPDQKYLILKFNSVENEKPYDENYVRAHIQEGEIHFRPVQNNHTFVKVFMLVDPMGKIPKWVVNLLQVKMPYEFIMALDKSAINTKLRPLPGIQNLINSIQK